MIYDNFGAIIAKISHKQTIKNPPLGGFFHVETRFIASLQSLSHHNSPCSDRSVFIRDSKHVNSLRQLGNGNFVGVLCRFQ